MSFQERNISASLVTFSLVLVYFLIRLFQFVQAGEFTPPQVFRLWGVVIVLGIVATIIMTILAHIASGIGYAIRTKEEPEIEDIQDERDQIIDLRGTRVAYLVFSIGALISMLTFVLGLPALIMFSLLIFFSFIAQISGDTARLLLYRRGF